jgi:hypothetical protein
MTNQIYFNQHIMSLFSGVLTLIESSERGQITSDEYSTVHEEIRDSVKRGYYLNGTLLLTMLSNTVAGMYPACCLRE